MGVDLKQFRSCGRNVKIDPSVVIEHPECYHDEITDVPMALSGEKTIPTHHNSNKPCIVDLDELVFPYDKPQIGYDLM